MKYLCDNCENYPCDDSEVKLMYRCPGFKPIPKPMTNAAKIRSMTDEELADLLYATMRGDNICDPYSGRDDWLDWLKQEVIE